MEDGGIASSARINRSESKSREVARMSGGHFDYQESHLGYIAEQLERDVEFNYVEYDSSKPIDTPYGFQHQPETIAYLKIMVDQLHRLQELLHEYERRIR
jgi:hypothetical protein